MLRGASSHLLDEAERSLHDALCVLSQVCANIQDTSKILAICTKLAPAVDVQDDDDVFCLGRR